MQGLPAKAAQSTLDMGLMEEQIARELARQKVNDERKRREIERLCAGSDELRMLQDKIKAAYLNKERNQQIIEKQFRDQVEIEQDAEIDMVMLKNKELNDIRDREENQRKLIALQNNKRAI